MSGSDPALEVSGTRMLTTPDGSTVAVHDLGGEGETLCLIHATGFHGRVFAELAQHVPGFHCIAIDLRGHGLSRPSPSWDGGWQGFAEDVITMVDGLGLERPAVFGHSCGGAAALLAEQARPGLWRGIYGYEPIVMPISPQLPPSFDNPMSQAALRRRSHFPSRLDALLNYSSKSPLNQLSPSSLRAYVEFGFEDLPDGGVELRCRREVEASVFANSHTHGAYQHLAEISCPVHFGCGAGGEVYGEDHVRLLADRVAAGGASARVQIFEELGHFGPLQDPAIVAADLTTSFAWRRHQA